MEESKKYRVKNCSPLDGEYTVIRDVDGVFWYYGCYDDVTRACTAAMECLNGIVVPTNLVEPIN